MRFCCSCSPVKVDGREINVMWRAVFFRNRHPAQQWRAPGHDERGQQKTSAKKNSRALMPPCVLPKTHTIPAVSVACPCVGVEPRLGIRGVSWRKQRHRGANSVINHVVYLGSTPRIRNLWLLEKGSAASPWHPRLSRLLLSEAPNVWPRERARP